MVIGRGPPTFSPRKLAEYPPGRWVWNSDNADSHDVRLGKRPKGVKRFRSELAASDYSFSRRLTVPGTYKIYCSIHYAMRETIVVRR